MRDRDDEPPGGEIGTGAPLGHRVRALLGLLLLLPPAALGAEEGGAAAGVIEVRCGRFTSTEGQALITLFDGKKTWLKLEKAREQRKVRLEGELLVQRFEGLPPGTYAVSVIHDANANGKLDMRWLPVPGPKEHSGTSLNAPARFGPPSWKDSSFTLAAGEQKTLEIVLRR